MRTILWMGLLGLTGLALGVTFFGEIDGARISWDSQVFQKLTSLDEVYDVALSQPIYVWICLGSGLVLGLLVGISSRKARKKGKAKKGTAGEAKSPISETPAPPPMKARPRQEFKVDGLDSIRPFLCKFLTGITLGIWKFYAVPQGSALVVVGLGKYRKCCSPGLGCILSFWGLYHRPYSKMPLVPWKERVDPYEEVDVFTSDGVRCSIDFMMCFRIVHPGKALFEVDDYEKGIKTTVISAVRNECGKEQARTLMASREKMAANLREFLDREISPWGIKIRLVEITKIDIAVQDGRKNIREIRETCTREERKKNLLQDLH